MTRRVQITDEQIKYDDNHDVLHVYFHPVGFSTDDEEYPGIVIRRAVNDNHVTGLVIMDFSKRDKNSLEQLLPTYDFSQLKKAH